MSVAIKITLIHNDKTIVSFIRNGHGDLVRYESFLNSFPHNAITQYHYAQYQWKDNLSFWKRTFPLRGNIKPIAHTRNRLISCSLLQFSPTHHTMVLFFKNDGNNLGLVTRSLKRPMYRFLCLEGSHKASEWIIFHTNILYIVPEAQFAQLFKLHAGL